MTILYSEVIANNPCPIWIIILFVITVMIGLLGICWGVYEYEIEVVAGGMVIVLLFALGLLWAVGTLDNLPYTKYKITIDETVTMEEFYEEYEIIDIEGDIYTVKEKKDDNKSRR